MNGLSDRDQVYIFNKIMDESLDAIRNWWRSFRGNDADIEWKNVKQEF